MFYDDEFIQFAYWCSMMMMNLVQSHCHVYADRAFKIIIFPQMDDVSYSSNGICFSLVLSTSFCSKKCGMSFSFKGTSSYLCFHVYSWLRFYLLL